MADAAGVDLDPNLTGTRLGDVHVDDLELAICLGNAGHLHRCHIRTLLSAAGRYGAGQVRTGADESAGG